MITEEMIKLKENLQIEVDKYLNDLETLQEYEVKKCYYEEAFNILDDKQNDISSMMILRMELEAIYNNDDIYDKLYMIINDINDFSRYEDIYDKELKKSRTKYDSINKTMHSEYMSLKEDIIELLQRTNLIERKMF